MKIIEKAFLRVGVGWCAATGQREDSALALSCGTELTAQVGYVYANDGHRGGHRLRDGEVTSCLRQTFILALIRTDIVSITSYVMLFKNHGYAGKWLFDGAVAAE